VTASRCRQEAEVEVKRTLPEIPASPPGAGKSRDHFLGDPTKSDGILGHKTAFTRIDIGRFSGIYYAFA
jgi:hypothetical protein